MPYPCDYCPKIFGTKQEYGVHLHELHLYSCWDCVKDCLSKAGRDQHIQRHHKGHPCHICYLHFTTEAALVDHYANLNTTNSSWCEVCDEEVGSDVLFWEHCHQQHPYQCPLVSSRCVGFPGKLNLDAHLIYWHHLFPCQHCHLVYRNEQQRADHVIAEHPIPCTVCTMVLSSADERDLHIIEAHRGVRCSVCQQVFTTELEFNLHFNQQHVIACDKCNRTFADEYSMDEHYDRAHTVQCPACEQPFSSEIEYQHHYNNEHMFMCNHCPMTFANEEARDQHKIEAHRVQCALCEKYFMGQLMDTHLDTAHRFSCFVCDRAFNRATDRDAHVAMAHNMPCDACHKVCKSMEELQLHCSIKHGIEKKEQS